MNTKMKTILFGLFFAVSLRLEAQDKYEYANIFNYSSAVHIVRSSAQTEKIPYNKVNDPIEVREQLLQIIEKMTEQGWEIMAINDDGGVVRYYLKRKKKE